MEESGNPALFILRSSFAYLRGILTEELKVAAGHLRNLKKERENQMESYIF